MSDETTKADGGWTSGTTPPPEAPGERAGFCQDCGKPLTAETMRTVGAGIFCEPCLAQRVAARPAGYYAAPPPGAPTVAGMTHPAFAAMLGFIPGVGAMYNGQYAKGVAHLIIFAVLASLADHVSGVFGLFVAGWIFYQVFDAYHTARAQAEGSPLPNAFGLNDIGERLGFGKNWSSNSTYTAPPVQPNYPVPPVAPPTSGSGWVGYVPPTAPHMGFAQSPPPPTSVPYTQPTPAAPWTPVPYAETYSGAAPGAPVVSPAPVPPSSRLPVGAIWLIGLGAVILLANFVPDLHLHGRWLLPVLLAAIAVWIFTRRLGTGVNILCNMRWPVVLMTLAVLFTLQAADAATLGQTWPVLFIVFGVLLLVERTLGTQAVAGTQPAGAAPSYSVVPESTPAPTEVPARAAWSDPAADASDTTKGGL